MHKYLHFPRISSRALFDELCPEERIRSLRRSVNLSFFNISTCCFNIIDWRYPLTGGVKENGFGLLRSVVSISACLGDVYKWRSVTYR